MTVPKTHSRWFRFSLQTLLLFVSLLGLWLACLGIVMDTARRQREAAAPFQEMGATVAFHPAGTGNVREIHFRNRRLTDTDLKRLKREFRKHSDIRSLSLGSTQVTDAGLEHLTALTNLDWLCLSHTQITDAGLGKLTTLGNLKGNQTGQVKLFIRPVPFNCPSRLIAPSLCEGVRERHKMSADMAMMNRKAMTIGLCAVMLLIGILGVACYRRAARVRSAIQQLATDGDIVVTYSNGTFSRGRHGTVFYCFHRVTGLEVLRHALTERDVETISSAVSLIELDLEYGRITESALRRLHGLDRVEVLLLSGVSVMLPARPGNIQLSGRHPPSRSMLDEVDAATPTRRIADDDVKHFGALSRLKRLSLGYADVSNEGVKDLGQLRQLEDVDLSFTLVGDDGVRTLCKSHPGLKVIRLASAGRWDGSERMPVSDRSVEALGGLRNLEVLDLDRTDITRKGLSGLVRLKALKELRVPECLKLTYGDLRKFKELRPDVVTDPSTADGPADWILGGGAYGGEWVEGEK